MIRAPAMQASRIVAAAAALALVTRSVPSSADVLRLDTIEYGAWPDAIARVQADTTSQGSEVHVRVLDATGHPAACGTYRLTLDAVSQSAFEVRDCDAETGSTALRLVHRDALFDHGDLVAHPRAAGITAVEVRTVASRGGAGEAAGTQVACSVGVRPFLRDLERGTQVALTPGRFVLRPASSTIQARDTADGWTLSGAARGTVTVEYDVFDTTRGVVVLHDRATLTCADTAVAPTGTAPSTLTFVAPAAQPVAPVRTVMGVLHEIIDPCWSARGRTGTRSRSEDIHIQIHLTAHARRFGIRHINDPIVEECIATGLEGAQFPLERPVYDMGFDWSLNAR